MNGNKSCLDLLPTEEVPTLQDTSQTCFSGPLEVGSQAAAAPRDTKLTPHMQTLLLAESEPKAALPLHGIQAACEASWHQHAATEASPILEEAAAAQAANGNADTVAALNDAEALFAPWHGGPSSAQTLPPQRKPTKGHRWVACLLPRLSMAAVQ